MIVGSVCVQVMAPRSGQDVRFNDRLLRTDGTESSWTYRWAMNWSYTFWRPSVPGFPLSTTMNTDLPGTTADSQLTQGAREGRSVQQQHTAEIMSRNGGAEAGDVVNVEGNSQTITIVVR